MRTVAIVATLTLAAIPREADAQTINEPARTLLRSTFEADKLWQPAGRDALVRAAKEYCEDVSRIYPRNSPAEDAWVRTEIAGSGNRPTIAARSPEYGRRLAAVFVEDCLKGASAYETSSDKGRALIYMALAFTRFRADAKYYAEKNGVSVDAFGLEFVPGATVEALLNAALAISQKTANSLRSGI